MKEYEKEEQDLKKIVSIALILTLVLTSAVSVFAADTKAVTEEDILSTWENDASEYSTGFPKYYHNPMFNDVVRRNAIDVSIFQYDIDWKKVKADGIDYAIIRIGGRYYGGGGLYPDDYFEQNYKEAKNAGVKVGIYFYSQAKTEKEAREEVDYFMDILDGRSLDLPVYMDYECPSGARISKMSKTQGTKNVIAFCEAVESYGYESGFYSYPAFINKYVDPSQISGTYNVWIAQYHKYCSYDYEYDMWQYSSTGHVDGIEDSKGNPGKVDVNFYYDKNTKRKDLSKTVASLEYIKTAYDEKEKKPKVTVNGLTEGKDYFVSYTDNTEIGTATVTVKGKNDYKGTITLKFEILKELKGSDAVFAKTNELRVYGSDRYETAFGVADTLKTYKGISKFDSVIVASGANYADALAASYLAEKKDAPILLTDTAESNEKRVKDYISKNLKSGGTVYVIGGTTAMTERFQNSLSGYNVKRLSGDDRYDTNLAILTEGGSASNGIIVSSGLNYADSLSASATGMPILLVGKTLTEEQIAYLSNSGGKVYIVGGNTAISADVEAQIREVKSSVSRIAGNNRYETSYRIASTFYSGKRTALITAYGMDYPDGLVASSLGQAMDSPVLLINKNDLTYAQQYAKQSSVESVAAVVGPSLLADSVVNSII